MNVDNTDEQFLVENAAYLEQLYHAYLTDKQSVPVAWRSYFARFSDEPADAGENFALPSSAMTSQPPENLSESKKNSDNHDIKQIAVLRLINRYRVRGHQIANLDPIKLYPRPDIEDLKLDYHQLNQNDLNTVFDTGSLVAPDKMNLSQIIKQLQHCYTSAIGFEYMHITDSIQKRWLQQQIEQPAKSLSKSTRISILERLTAAEGLERYLHNKYVGQKRFSLEGGEALIPLLDQLIAQASSQGVEEIVIGMAHRGRLNVLINILGKSPAELFDEFEGKVDQSRIGDVKYHKGFSTDLKIGENLLHLVLAFNPSHLEIVNPVVQGSVRARQQRYADYTGERIIPVMIHGDSAFAGQGVVMETLQLSQSRGFTTGGTVHIVVNNQIGFTTSNPLDTRSTLYCTDVAKMVQAPIFHVNGDDPDAIIRCVQIALDFRQTFNKDVVIDMICYRRHGHNEADEPACTQPRMYRKIRRRTALRKLYAARLIKQQAISQHTVDNLVDTYRKLLESGQVVAKNIFQGNNPQPRLVSWKKYFHKNWLSAADTSVSLERLDALSQRLQQLPNGFELHPRVEKIIDDRRKMAAGAMPYNWGGAEILAYASIIEDGFEVRLSGQDSGRGTFFHRHSVLHNQIDGAMFTPLQHLFKHQPNFLVVDSLLSEEAVMAFEYGYATASPKSLVIWEAQFGDFANGAQVVIDQFISSGEEKWQRLSGLVLYLPHGYEGQGAEHSSARLERFLQLCAGDNIQVCVPTTPAQLFHMLRRQVLRPYRKPLIVMTPKSLLRHPLAVSSLEDFSSGGFQCLLADSYDDSQSLKRIILCSGKIYFQLLEYQQEHQISDGLLIRIEQLNPFPSQQLASQLKRFQHISDIVWCQEEPENQGAWFFCQQQLQGLLQAHQQLSYIGREASAAPAVGSFKLHVKQQDKLIKQAFSF